MVKGQSARALLLRYCISGWGRTDLIFSRQPQLLFALPLLQFAQGNTELVGLGTKASPVRRGCFRSCLLGRRYGLILHTGIFYAETPRALL